MAKPKYVVFSNDVAPVHEGVYQRQLSHAGSARWFWARFSKDGWSVSGPTFAGVKNESRLSHYQVGDKSPYSSLRWRGLAEKPE